MIKVFMLQPKTEFVNKKFHYEVGKHYAAYILNGNYVIYNKGHGQTFNGHKMSYYSMSPYLAAFDVVSEDYVQNKKELRAYIKAAVN